MAAGATLQWSHGILAMDRALLYGAAELAGMLQWSHGILAMDSRESLLTSLILICFNGAMAF